MCSASPSRAPRVCAIVSVTSDGSRSEARPTQKTPALYKGTSSAAASRARRVLPEPPGPVSVSRRVPPWSSDRTSCSSLPPHERTRRAWKVGVRDRLERREALVAELIDRDRALDVLQAVFPEVSHCEPLDELPSRLREQDLTSVARGCDTRREVDVDSHVALGGDAAACPCAGPCARGSARGERLRDREGGSHGARSRGNATKKASPWVSTSTPPVAAHASRTTRRCSASASAYASAPSRAGAASSPRRQ